MWLRCSLRVDLSDAEDMEIQSLSRCRESALGNHVDVSVLVFSSSGTTPYRQLSIYNDGHPAPTAYSP